MFANIEGAYPFMQIQLPPDFQIVGTPLISYTLESKNQMRHHWNNAQPERGKPVFLPAASV